MHNQFLCLLRWWFGKPSSMQLRKCSLFFSLNHFFKCLTDMYSQSHHRNELPPFFIWKFHQSGSSHMIGSQIADNSIHIIVWYFWSKSFHGLLNKLDAINRRRSVAIDNSTMGGFPDFKTRAGGIRPEVGGEEWYKNTGSCRPESLTASTAPSYDYGSCTVSAGTRTRKRRPSRAGRPITGCHTSLSSWLRRVIRVILDFK